MKLFSTRMHGIIDYLSVGTLFTLPRALGWSARVTGLMTNAALGTLVYSLLTRYELGLVKVLPMKGHLALDGMSGALFCGAPLLFPDEDTSVKAALVGFGLFELAAAFMTETEPSLSERASQATDAIGDRIQDHLRDQLSHAR